MKGLLEYIKEEIEDFDDSYCIDQKNLNYGELKERIDLALVGDIKIYSDTVDFLDRKKAIASKFISDLSPEEVNADRISKTKVFNYYILHLIESYKKNIDEEALLNVSSENELRHQIATDIVLMIKNKEMIEEN